MADVDLAGLFEQMTQRFNPEKAKDVDALIQFDLSGDSGGQYWVRIADGACTAGEGAQENPRITIKASAETWQDVAAGKTNVVNAFMMGKLKVQGDMGLAVKMQQMFALG
jgi:putative sterol carrier protein